MKFKFGLYFLLPFIRLSLLILSFAQNNEPDKTFSSRPGRTSGKSQRIICVLILKY
jgi:hypothetical protein